MPPPSEIAVRIEKAVRWAHTMPEDEPDCLAAVFAEFLAEQGLKLVWLDGSDIPRVKHPAAEG